MKVETERYSYPSVPGSHGIDFEKLFAKAEQVVEGDFLSESGRLMSYRIGSHHNSSHRIWVVDSSASAYSLNATLAQNGIVHFGLYTRRYDESQYQPFGVHPDFFAKAFVGVALDFFKHHYRVIGCEGKWNRKSRNGVSFLEIYDPSRDNRVESALTTWSAKTFSYYGFSKISDRDIDITRDSKKNIQTVSALFRPE